MSRQWTKQTLKDSNSSLRMDKRQVSLESRKQLEEGPHELGTEDLQTFPHSHSVFCHYYTHTYASYFSKHSFVISFSKILTHLLLSSLLLRGRQPCIYTQSGLQLDFPALLPEFRHWGMRSHV